MDHRLNGRAGGKVEAISVPGGSSYSSKCHITIIGREEHKEAISKHLHTCRVPFYDIIKAKAYLGYDTNTYATDLTQSSAIQNARGQYTTQILSEEEIIHSMDNIWGEQESAVNDMKLQVSDMSVLTTCLQSSLFQHQQVGIAWMLDRENVKSIELPPFYELIQGSSSSSSSSSSSGAVYRHSLTKHDYRQRPINIRGGILADVMGLGKSLCVIGLILTNPPPGKVYTPPTPVSVLPIFKFEPREEVVFNNDTSVAGF